MMRFASALVVALLPAAVLWADDRPSGTTPEPSAAEIEYFEKKVRPLLARHCYECHSGESDPPSGGLRLDSRRGILQGGDSGPAVIPGKPDESRLIEAVRYRNVNLQMPPEGELSTDEIAELVRWIARGAPHPPDANPGPAPNAEADLTEARQFWAFQPVRKNPLPAVRDTAWPQRRIDHFLLAAMERRNLAPSPSAGRRALIRRATFDLTGLPPTPEEVEAFVNDPGADAYPRLIERLLASPHYGERWARFWLDLARYTDTTASWLDSTAQAWLYRDWVVQAFNGDVPYDEFVVRQLATDFLPETGPADIPALGFLGLSPTYWKELKLDKDIIRNIVADEWEERVDAVSRTFLGLTVACARCHDHKFDPITMEDYYALAGVFASSRLAARPIIPEPAAQRVAAARKQVAELETQIQKLRRKKPVGEEAKRRIEGLSARIREIRESTPQYDSPLANAVAEASLYVLPDGPNHTRLEYRPEEPRDVPLMIRGNAANPGSIVPRRFLEVLSDGEPTPFQQGSGRLELAQSIVDDAAPLTARVIVNRIWQQHFGRGLVTTPSNFGTQGARPTHPKLLDDLAARFIDNGWSMKWLHREMMLSAAYRQSSRLDPDRQAVDPDNTWLWRMNRRRLNIEAWRDAMLAVAGNLDSRMGGLSQDLAEMKNVRRTIYGTVDRRDLDDMLRLYDFPDPNAHSPARETTTTPLQQLFVLNSSFVQRQADLLAQRLMESSPSQTGRITAGYRLLFGRPPNERELQLGMEFLDSAAQPGTSLPADAGHAASAHVWRNYVHVLLGSNEFLFVD